MFKARRVTETGDKGRSSVTFVTFSGIWRNMAKQCQKNNRTPSLIKGQDKIVTFKLSNIHCYRCAWFAQGPCGAILASGNY